MFWFRYQYQAAKKKKEYLNTRLSPPERRDQAAAST